MAQPVSIKDRLDGIVESGRRRLGLQSSEAAESGGRVEIVHGALQAFAEGDHYAFLDVLDAEVAWDVPDSGSFPGRGGVLGRDAVRDEYLGDIERTYTEFGFTPESFLEAGDQNAVVVIGRFHGKDIEGCSFDTRAVQVWEFSGNSATRVSTITDSAVFPEVITEAKQHRVEMEAEHERKKEGDSEEKEGDSED